MPRRFKALSLALIALMALGVYTAKAYVTGYFETHISFEPQATATEVELIEFDFQNDLTVTVAASGLSTTLHTHFGIAGIEDVIVTFTVDNGIAIEDTLVFGRFAYRSTTPFYDTLHFLKKRVSTSICLGGVCFSNLALFEDTNAFSSQTPAYAFGDVMTISGQTPSGISVEMETGICAEQGSNRIKKHSWYYTVNEDCAGPLKPDLMFDFETLSISGIPLTSGVTADWDIECATVSACTLVNTIAFSDGPIPLETSFTFSDLFSLAFEGATLTLSQGAGTLEIEIDPDGTIALASVDLSITLNPDSNPADLSASLNVSPGVGITDADVGLSLERVGLDFEVLLDFHPGAGGTARFSSVVFSLGASVGMVDFDASMKFVPDGLDRGDLHLTIGF